MGKENEIDREKVEARGVSHAYEAVLKQQIAIHCDIFL
jgi:hypothetical protein